MKYQIRDYIEALNEGDYPDPSFDCEGLYRQCDHDDNCLDVLDSVYDSSNARVKLFGDQWGV